MAMIRFAPICFAESTPSNPTAPSPTTATVEPGLTFAASAANHPVPITSDKVSRLGMRSSEGTSDVAIGYGFHTIKYANGKSREFFQIGVSGNKTGISVYVLGLKDKKYLAKTYGRKLGKASVTGYCIRFKALKDINIDTLEVAIRYGLAAHNEKGKLTK